MAKGPARPYFSFSINQLEQLYAEHSQDQTILQDVATELAYRETDRAGRLAQKVRENLKVKSALSGTSGTKPVSADRPAATMPVPRARPLARASAKPANPTTAVQMPPPLEDLARVPHLQRSGVRNKPDAIIADWIALEALSPQTFRRAEDLCGGLRSRIVALCDRLLPWQSDLKAQPNTRLFFQVILGTIDMDAATAQLIERFGDDEERTRPEHSKAIIASVLLDKDGLPVEGGLAVSSFAWALPRVLKGQVDGLEVWPSIEAEVQGKLSALFKREDEDGAPMAVDRAQIGAAFRWLVSNFDLPANMVEAPAIAIKVFHGYRAKSPPDALLLNSFYLRDLSRVAGLLRSGETPPALSAYLGLSQPSDRLDVKDQHDVLEAVVAPHCFPLARWPAPGGHPLVLLQQAAVNITQIELAGNHGIVAVNGPPGTGKTTLLRDVIAARVLARAEAMAAFENPNTAFTPSGHKIKVGAAAFFQLYRLHDSLKGHEIVVASSNNKAVENISRELPAQKAVGDSNLTYFKSVSDRLFAKAGSGEDDSPEIPADPLETWGLIAAVMGNAGNRAAFQKTVWWDEDYALRLYLKAASGQNVTIEIRDPDTGQVIGHRLPAIIDAEKPPSPEQASRNWRDLRARFLKEKAAIEGELDQLEHIRSLCLTLPKLREAAEHSAVTLMAAKDGLSEKQLVSDACQKTADATRLSLQTHVDQRQALLPIRPGFWSCLFRTRSWKQWSASYQVALDAETSVRRDLAQADIALKSALEDTQAAASIHDQAQAAHHLDANALDETQHILNRQKQLYGDLLIDEAFVNWPHENQQNLSPWIPSALHARRAALFELALGVQKAFIDASAQKVLHNISALFSDAASIALDAERRELLVDLWATLFTVVPVISTTFASIDRMFGDLPPATLGWLLIDEAGQATPQAAAGALMRCQRAVVVGDPLQIEPVVSLPEKLNSRLAEYFEVTRTRFTAPETSAQTLADRASRFVGTFPDDKGLREVGVPLLVHRRCRNPMFAISNAIAYDQQMVLATPARPPTAMARCLGGARWFDVSAQSAGKWSHKEGDVLVHALSRLAEVGVMTPDIFVITPFRIVADELRRRILQEHALMKTLGVSARDWASERIGTIHTFQGREADTVFLVLGATGETQAGARAWATARPNILNVAVSRARENLYVIGSRSDWAGMGYARELSNSLESFSV